MPLIKRFSLRLRPRSVTNYGSELLPGGRRESCREYAAATGSRVTTSPVARPGQASRPAPDPRAGACSAGHEADSLRDAARSDAGKAHPSPMASATPTAVPDQQPPPTEQSMAAIPQREGAPAPSPSGAGPSGGSADCCTHATGKMTHRPNIAHAFPRLPAKSRRAQSSQHGRQMACHGCGCQQHELGLTFSCR